MKIIYKSILFLAVTGMLIIASSCSKDDSGSNGGAPYISYVRIPNPVSKDSLLVEGVQGQWVAIMGGNLQNTKEVWFNNQMSPVSPYYITANSILDTIPSAVPSVVTNKIKLVFNNGDSLLYDFTVKISKPALTSLDNEYAMEGEKMVLNGNYLYKPITVTFPGGAVTSSEDGSVVVDPSNTSITITVPAGATTPGPLIVTDNFGTTESTAFWFHDNRNIFMGFDSPTGAGTNVTAPGSGAPPLINGPYTRLTKPTMGAWAWTEVFSWVINHNIPDDAILNPGNYSYKFEINTVKPYNSNGVRIWVTSQDSNTNGGFFEWVGAAPNGMDTKGEWKTKVFPFKDVMAKNVSIGVLPQYFFAFIFCGAGSLDCDICYDNFRIVPNQ
jgi:hypothetical protein